MSIEKIMERQAEALESIAESLSILVVQGKPTVVNTLATGGVAGGALVTGALATGALATGALATGALAKAPPVITKESLDQLSMQVNEMKGDEGKFIYEILASFGVDSISSLPVEHYEAYKTIMDTA